MPGGSTFKRTKKSKGNHVAVLLQILKLPTNLSGSVPSPRASNLRFGVLTHTHTVESHGRKGSAARAPAPRSYYRLFSS